MDTDKKIIDGERVVKARSVAKGSQERNKDNLSTDPPTRPVQKKSYVLC